LKVVYNVKHEDIPLYLCASDVLISTSKWEGSLNIIKEAMACNLPIVTTDVGDVRWLLEVVNNTAIVRNSELEIASAIKQVLKHSAQSMLEIGYWS